MEDRHLTIKVLSEKPNINQRELAKEVGVSLGKINSIIKEAIENGLIKRINNEQDNKYIITQRGNDELLNALKEIKDTKLIINKEEKYRVKQAVILAAGRTIFDVPVGLLEVDNTLVIERHIKTLKECGINKIVIVTGYNSEAFEEKMKNESGIILVKNDKYKWTGTMKSLSMAKGHINDDFILIESDLILENIAIPQILNSINRDCVLITNESGSGDEAFVQLEDNCLFKMAKDVHQFNRIDGEMIGVTKISYKLFNMMLKEYERNINPYLNYEYMLLDMARNYKVHCLKIDDLLWGEIDNEKQYNYIKSYLYPRIKRKDLEFEKEAIKNIISSVLDIDKANINDVIPAGGMTNKNYKVIIKGESYILRVPGLGTEEMISRNNEMENSNLASLKGYNAETLYFNQDSGIKITKFIEGAETLTGASAKKEENMKLVTSILRELHNSDMNMVNIFNPFEELLKYEDILKGNTVKYYDEYKETRERVFCLDGLMKEYGSELVPSHNDTVPENFIKDVNGRLYLIDWEYSGLNDEMWDLAAHSIECNFTSDEEELFLNLYFNGNPDRESRLRILMNKICQDFLWAVWTLVKEAEGDDFGSYGVDRFNRAKANLDLLFKELR
ncbi:phosphotransferase [Clostridium sp. NSJ-6]|uniref:Phosphotransferase n=1 Tax=Clostridium hominis TaxID=2763036 RepID=A0ABR7D9I1_9CLOT|nr:winged helix-turn-helix transcriptional regulator [Clostridium hominis]MBC5628044.1 phosphotransferase [Clostridium hominis]